MPELVQVVQTTTVVEIIAGGSPGPQGGGSDVVVNSLAGTQIDKAPSVAAVNAALQSVGGVTDHGALTGLGDDDHLQYHTDTRGDARYSPVGHGHAIADTSGLQAALDSKASDSATTTALAGKAATSHTHVIADTSGLQAALDSKASDSATTTALAGKQPLDATLSALAAITTAADKLIYSNGVDTFALTDLSSFIRTLLDDPNQAAAQATLGLLIGTNVLAPNGNGSQLTNLTESQLPLGSAGNPIIASLSTDTVFAGSNAVFATLHTITIPSAGLWRLDHFINETCVTAGTFWLRVAMGTAVIAAASGDMLGWSFSGPAQAVMQTPYVTGSPNTITLQSRASAGAKHFSSGLMIRVTTPGTILLQWAKAGTTANDVTIKNSRFSAEK